MNSQTKKRYLFDDSPDDRGRPQHLHKLNDKPLTGTSTITDGVKDKSGLIWWAVGEGLKTLGWTPIMTPKGKIRVRAPIKPRLEAAKLALEAIKTLDVDNFLSKLDEAYYAHSNAKNSAAKDGKDLHSNLERYVKFSIDKYEGRPAQVKDKDIQNFIDWSIENVEKFLASEIHMYSEKHWVGGIADCIAKMKGGKMAVIDFKRGKQAYPEMFWQCAGYSIQLEENGGFTPKGERVLEPIKCDTHIVIPFGAKKFSPDIVHDEKGINRDAFLAALTIYKSRQAIS